MTVNVPCPVLISLDLPTAFCYWTKVGQLQPRAERCAPVPRLTALRIGLTVFGRSFTRTRQSANVARPRGVSAQRWWQAVRHRLLLCSQTALVFRRNWCCGSRCVAAREREHWKWMCTKCCIKCDYKSHVSYVFVFSLAQKVHISKLKIFPKQFAISHKWVELEHRLYYAYLKCLVEQFN